MCNELGNSLKCSKIQYIAHIKLFLLPIFLGPIPVLLQLSLVHDSKIPEVYRRKSQPDVPYK